MTARLRELAERWKASADIAAAKGNMFNGGMIMTKQQCASELISILDAEGDGGEVAWREKVDEIANNIGESLNAGCDQDAVDRINVYVDELFALSKRTHPARSGGVSDADVDAVIKSVERVNVDGMDGDSWDRILVRAALTHFAKGAEVGVDAEDAARYRWLRISACEIAWNEWCSYAPGYSANGPEELDQAIDAARKGERHE